MKIKEFDEIVITENLANGTFKKGTIGVVVDVYLKIRAMCLSFLLQMVRL